MRTGKPLAMRPSLKILRQYSIAQQKLVEIGAMALGETSGLGDIARGTLQTLDEVTAREFIARIIERRDSS